MVKSVTIDTSGHHGLNLGAARTNLAALFQEEDDLMEGTMDDGAPEIHRAATEAPNDLLASSKSLRCRAEAILSKGVSDNDAAEILILLDKSSTAITHRDWPTLNPNSEVGDKNLG